MQGDIGKENDLIAPRPDTLKLAAPDSILKDDENARPSIRHSGRYDLGFMDGHASICFWIKVIQINIYEQMVHAIFGVAVTKNNRQKRWYRPLHLG